jgi:hypothetical protein
MTLIADKTYREIDNTAPHPAGFGPTLTPSDATVVVPTRWVMITDLVAKAISLRLAGARYPTPAAIVGVAGDISAAAGGVYNSSTGGKFSSLKVNDTVVIKGFANANNNGTFQVTVATGTSITVVAPGSTLAPGTIAETPAGTAATIQGPKLATQDTVTFTALPGVMYPICADKVLATGTAATSVIGFY